MKIEIYGDYVNRGSLIKFEERNKNFVKNVYNQMKNFKEVDLYIVKNNERKIIFNNNYRKKRRGRR